MGGGRLGTPSKETPRDEFIASFAWSRPPLSSKLRTTWRNREAISRGSLEAADKHHILAGGCGRLRPRISQLRLSYQELDWVRLELELAWEFGRAHIAVHNRHLGAAASLRVLAYRCAGSRVRFGAQQINASVQRGMKYEV